MSAVTIGPAKGQSVGLFQKNKKIYDLDPKNIVTIPVLLRKSLKSIFQDPACVNVSPCIDLVH